MPCKGQGWNFCINFNIYTYCYLNQALKCSFPIKIRVLKKWLKPHWNLLHNVFYIILHLTSTDNYSVICLGTMLFDTIFGYYMQRASRIYFWIQSTIFGSTKKSTFQKTFSVFFLLLNPAQVLAQAGWIGPNFHVTGPIRLKFFLQNCQIWPKATSPPQEQEWSPWSGLKF